MGCATSCVQRTTMSFFSKHFDSEDRAKLDRKLYIAKESPEPVFDLSECQLKHVPSGIYSICKVYRKEYLYLNDNKLQSLDNGGQLADLYLIKVLNISSNEFLQLSIDIRYLVNLTELYIQNNQVKKLPDSIQYLKILKILDVSNNKINSLTPQLGKLKNLQILKIIGNPDLTELCPELCQASNLVQLELDHNNFSYPPIDIVGRGTVQIMKYLCEQYGIEYKQPQAIQTVHLDPISIEIINPFKKRPDVFWEEKEAEIIDQENKYHQAAKKQREKFLSQVMQDQLELDAEIAKVHEYKDVERQRLIQSIQQEEKGIEFLVRNYIQLNNLKPEALQQQVEHEKTEHDHLLQIIKQNYDNIKKSDVLKAMEKVLDESCSFQTIKSDQQNRVVHLKQSMLLDDLESTGKLEKLMRARDESHAALSQQLIEDQDIQKAIVASLIERVDAKSWSLNQEISLVSSNLAKLSVLEQEKKKIHVAYNFNELLHQRTQLLYLLDDLMLQQNKRRAQLIVTMKEMESETDATTDFWLKSYQRLVESVPKTFLEVGKIIDPALANNLLQEGAIHCLPFLVKFLFSDEGLSAVTSEMLKKNGVSLSSDRERILKAIKSYVIEKHKNNNIDEAANVAPSAPSFKEAEVEATGVINSDENGIGAAQNSECVICMDSRCEVAFVPCGHLCCCLVCSEKDSVNLCPMCRSAIDRKIKIIAV